MDKQIDPVQQRAGYPAAIALYLIRGAATFVQRVLVVAAGARIHCRYQLEAGGVTHFQVGAGDGDFTGFQRFAQYVEYLARILRLLSSVIKW